MQDQDNYIQVTKKNINFSVRGQFMSEIINITVNGAQMQATKGSLLIDKLLDENIHIPHFCYHQALGKDGNCRMCMVEIEGQKRPQIACDTPIKDGMIVRTTGKNIEKVRRDILELELINHPIDCPTCRTCP